MKNQNLILMLMLALTTSVANAQNMDSDRPERQPNPAIVEARGDIQADRAALNDLRDATKAQMEAKRAENKATAVSNAEARNAARSSIVHKRQAMVDTRLATVREKNPELADIMEGYYDQIMAKMNEVQAKKTAMIASVSSGEMTGAEAREEFKAYIEVEKAEIKSLMEELKAAIMEYRESRSTG